MAAKKQGAVSVKKERPKANTVCDPSIRDDEIEFLRAMEEYQQKNNRPLPTWSEVLVVLRGLGYVKVGHEKKEHRGPDWQSLLSALMQERDQLQLELAEVRKQKAAAVAEVAYLHFGPPEDIDEEALLKEAATQPPFEEVVAEIERILR